MAASMIDCVLCSIRYASILILLRLLRERLIVFIYVLCVNLRLAVQYVVL